MTTYPLHKLGLRIPIHCRVNGEPQVLLVKPWQTLLEALRDELGLTGTKEGCGNGNCGCCTVLMNGKTVTSCLVLAPEAEGADIVTVEGLAQGNRLDPLQKAFMEYGALQCGFCTPGFLMSAKYLLQKIPNPTEHDVRLGIAGNLCRCTGYDKIVRAILAVARGEVKA
ncbi:MAG: (2Fe-2S)-binding protein [Dehalococcoidia bacterium]|nr:(2Fe-2S)-binding protein [Dehalococcoidia bacterium]MDW8119660.1 (2Fe-2S)-binding protein [Chloroflexota bacterium]